MTEEKASTPPAKTPGPGERFSALIGGLSPALQRKVSASGSDPREVWKELGLELENDDQVNERHPYGYAVFTHDGVTLSKFSSMEEMVAGLAKQLDSDEEVSVVPFVGRVLPIWVRSDHVVVGPAAANEPHWRASFSGQVDQMGAASERLGESSDYTHTPPHLRRPTPIMPLRLRKKRKRLPPK